MWTEDVSNREVLIGFRKHEKKQIGNIWMYRKTVDIKKCEECENGLCEAAIKSDDAIRFREEIEHEYRTPFIRDRDRIIYSKAFQRLVDKTQLFPSADPSKYTTRLMHSVKVSQIAQTLARAFKLNEDLTEAISLGHDLGHAPFGHLGEEVLRELMIDENGFEHNEESVLVALIYEPEMNLTVQTMEGILKHTKFDMNNYVGPERERTNPFGELYIPRGDKKIYKDPFNYWGGIGENGKIIFKSLASYEGQVVDIADEIAYLVHDIWDLVLAGAVDTYELPHGWLYMFGNDPGAAINTMVKGIIEENYENIEKEKKGEIRYEIKHPSELNELVKETKEWFEEKIYKKTDSKDAREIIIRLFDYLKDNTKEMYKRSIYGEYLVNRGYKDKHFACHFIASLTDKEARAIYSEVFGRK